MDTAQSQNPPAPIFPKPAFLTDKKEDDTHTPEPSPSQQPTAEPVPQEAKTDSPQPSPEPTPSPAGSSADYGQKLADELAKLDTIYQGEFTGALPTKDGSSNAIFLKEPPISTPEFLKESRDEQMKAIEKAGLVGYLPGNGLVVVQGEAASKLYQFMHADDKKRFGEKMETSVGTIDYSYAKPEIKSMRDLVGDTDLEGLTEVSLWNQATKTTAEVAEMKKFVLREEKIEEALKEAYEATAKLAEKAA